MPEQRGRTYHQNRVAETLREEISAMLEGQLSDPRINFGYVSEVVMAPGGKSARIYVAVDGDAKDEEEMLEGLEAARGYIRHQLLQRMGVRHIPELFFQVDHSEPVRARIDELLGRVERRNRQKEKLQRENAQATGALEPEPSKRESE
ncbi:MAG TPA: 30S ribosome-binding factor RbfA [Acidobacteriaceae bacterium]|nr:30S ribosome-binding factor RbfA [Acidobacteriaceae bacterium]